MADILIVDDTIEHTALFATVLQSLGTVDVAGNGEEALAYLEKKIKYKEDLPRVILTDVDMPKMDGFELCYILKNTPVYWHIKVILFTAMWPNLTRKMALTVTPDDYILKPIESSKLIEKVKSYLT